MNRFPWLSALLLALVALCLAAGPALAQDDDGADRNVLVSVGGDLTLAAGETADAVLVINGDARIEGTAIAVAVVNGTLTMAGGTVTTVAVVKGTADIGPGSTVSDDVLELNSTVNVDATATVGGEVRSMAVDLAGIGLALGVLGVLAWMAFVLVTWAAGLALAAFGSRQVRSAEWLISSEPLKTFLAGLATLLLPPLIGVLLMITVIGLPVGLALLFMVWPTLAFLGWLVGATWIGEWILRAAGRAAPERRPYLGVTVGLVVATLASLIPLVGAIIALFGMGGVTLAGWRMLRQPAVPSMANAGFTPIGGR